MAEITPPRTIAVVEQQRTGTIVPTGIERTFGPDQIIVSKTDLQGRLTYVNDVFLEVSRFREDELIGRPHNVIRHPDMPRTIFKLLWTEIAAGRELFAYVVNLCKDGGHYWVFAHVTPTISRGSITGYHSNRRVADRGAVARVADVYRTIRLAESRHSHPREAMAAGSAALDGLLADHGQTYDEFVWSLAAAPTTTRTPAFAHGGAR